MSLPVWIPDKQMHEVLSDGDRRWRIRQTQGVGPQQEGVRAASDKMVREAYLGRRVTFRKSLKEREGVRAWRSEERLRQENRPVQTCCERRGRRI